jgi:hypothetical protein
LCKHFSRRKSINITYADCHHHHNHHHHHISVKQLGHLLTRSGLTCPEVSSKFCHDSFCKSDSSVSLPWVIYYEAFCLNVVCWLGYCKNVKQSSYRPEQVQRVLRGIALSFRDLGARRDVWSASRPGRFTPGKARLPLCRL